VVIDPPAACECCGGNRLRKLGEDVTRTLEVIPRQWKVVETVREKFTCRDSEKISQAPAPFHVIPRGWAGPSLLAMLLYEKFGQHQPLNRQTVMRWRACRSVCRLQPTPLERAARY
jgi:transposase